MTENKKDVLKFAAIALWIILAGSVYSLLTMVCW